MENNQEKVSGEKRESQSITKNENSMPGNVSARPGVENKGSGPAPDIANGGGVGQQPKENTGNETTMGGASGGTEGLGDPSEGNDNTTR